MKYLLLIVLLSIPCLGIPQSPAKVVTFIEFEDGWVFCLKDNVEDSIAECFPVMNEQFTTCDITDPSNPDCSVESI